MRHLNKDNTGSLLKHVFLEIRDTRKQTFGEEHKPVTLTFHRNGVRRFFLYGSEGENFNIGDDANLNNKLSAKQKQLKAAGKGSHPNKADPEDDNQIEKLWLSGAISIQNTRQLLRQVWWNKMQMLRMQEDKSS